MNWSKYFLASTFVICQLFVMPDSAKALASTSVKNATALRPEQALTRTWRSNSNLLQLRREYARSQARLLQVGLLPNPEIGLIAEDFAGSAAYTDDRFTQFTLEWIQTFPLGDRLTRAKHLAELESYLLNWEYRVQQLRLAEKVFLHYSRLRYLKLRKELAQEMLENARVTFSMIEINVHAGKQPPIAALQAKQKVLTLDATMLDLSSQQRIAEIELSNLWGDNVLAEMPEFHPFVPHSVLPALVTYQERLQTHPLIVRWKLERDIRNEALAKVQAEALPDITASGGFRYHPSLDWGLVASVTLPLSLFNYNQGSIQDAGLHQKSLDGERAQDMMQLNSELSLAYERYTSAYKRRQIYQQKIQFAQEVFHIAKISFESGKTNYLEVLQSQQNYVDTKEALIETEWELEQNLIHLQVLTQDMDMIEDIPITET